MTEIRKESNHNFNIGDIVYILLDYAIIPCIVTGIKCSPSYKSDVESVKDLIDYTTIIYTLNKIKSDNTFGERTFTASIRPDDTYEYHSSRVYSSIDELLSDLEDTVGKC